MGSLFGGGGEAGATQIAGPGEGMAEAPGGGFQPGAGQGAAPQQPFSLPPGSATKALGVISQMAALAGRGGGSVGLPQLAGPAAAPRLGRGAGLQGFQPTSRLAPPISASRRGGTGDYAQVLAALMGRGGGV